MVWYTVASQEQLCMEGKKNKTRQVDVPDQISEWYHEIRCLLHNCTICMRQFMLN